jgi:hypothetical protein
MNDLEKMSAKELKSLKTNIDKELERRKRLDYDKLLKNFADALYELYEKFPYEYCFADESVDWEDLRENYDWNF